VLQEEKAASFLEKGLGRHSRVPSGCDRLSPFVPCNKSWWSLTGRRKLEIWKKNFATVESHLCGPDETWTFPHLDWLKKLGNPSSTFQIRRQKL